MGQRRRGLFLTRVGAGSNPGNTWAGGKKGRREEENSTSSLSLILLHLFLFVHGISVLFGMCEFFLKHEQHYAFEHMGMAISSPPVLSKFIV